MNTFVTQLRWPEELRAAILEAAQFNRRSMNAEIIFRLEASLASEARLEGRAA
jgi:hypothetical protein